MVCLRGAKGSREAPLCADAVRVAGEGDGGPSVGEERGLRLQEGDVGFEILLRAIQEGVAVAAGDGHSGVCIVQAVGSLLRRGEEA